MKTLNKILLTLASILALMSCEKDGEKIYLQSLGSDELIATTDKVVLSVETSQKVVLSFAWKGQDVQISDTTVGTAAKAKNYMEVSLSEDFSGQIYKDETTSNSIAYKGGELNSIVNGLGAKVGEANNVFFRLGSATGENIPYAYSNVVKVAVTPYVMDMNTGIVVEATDQNEVVGETGVILYSPEANGIYSGFMFTPYGWYHYFLKEGNGLMWGTAGDEGAFHITSDAGNNRQNMWFPGTTGCYYVNVNTKEATWDALYISSLAISGLSEEPINLTLDKENNLWIASFTATEAGEKVITISGNGDQWNVETGTNDGAGIPVNVAFANENNNLVLADNAGNISVTIPEAGECTIKLDLINPNDRKVYVEAGGTDIPEEPEVKEYIYVMGIDSDKYEFNNKIYLFNEDNIEYAGIRNVVPSQWGYYFFNADAWGNDSEYKYGKSDNTANTNTNGELLKGGTEIPALTENGLYLFEVSLKNLTYKTTKIGDKIYLYNGMTNGGLIAMTPTDIAGEFSTVLELSSDSEWGMKFYLFDDWSYNFVDGGENKLYYNGTNKDGNGIAVKAGKYTVKANIIEKTYSIEPIKE